MAQTQPNSASDWLSRLVTKVEHMYGGVERTRLMQLGELADLAESDLAMCVAVVQTLRTVRDQLLVSEALHECQQDASLLASEAGVSDDGSLGLWDFGSADGQPSQVA